MKLFIIAGEESGDIHAANMVRHLRKRMDVTLYGTGGSNLKSLGQEQYFTTDDMSIIGFGEIISRLPFIFKMFKVLKAEVERVKPDAVLLVDYPGFNLKFAKKMQPLGIPVLYFIAPQVWAWHYSRVNIIREYVKKMLCILPFEEKIFRSEGIDATYVGNPVIDNIVFKYSSVKDFREAMQLDSSKKIIGILPGSRRREIDALMPVIVEAQQRLKDEFQFVLGRASSITEEHLNQYIAGTGIKVCHEASYDVMRGSDLMWNCSGTATLETAIIGTPMTIMYISGKVTKFIGKLVAKSKFVGLPNIIAGKEIAPELLFEECNPDRLVKETRNLFAQYAEISGELVKIGELFSGRNPSELAAEEIYSFLKTL